MINNKEFNFLFKIKSAVPNSVKHFLKNTIFIVPTLKNTINDLKNENKILRNIIKKKDQKIDEINKFNIKNNNFVTFYLSDNEKKIEKKFNNYKITKFYTNDLKNGKADDALASGYIEEFNDKIFITTGDGLFLYFNKKELDKENFKSNLIKSNISEIIKYPEFYTQSKFGVKDILIDDKKLYVSYSNQIIDDNNNDGF